VARLPLPGSEIRFAELAQSGCDLGSQSCLVGVSRSRLTPPSDARAARRTRLPSNRLAEQTFRLRKIPGIETLIELRID
jgi:hypothetical protein